MVIGYWLLVIGGAFGALLRRLKKGKEVGSRFALVGRWEGMIKPILPTLSPSHLLTFIDKSVAPQRKPKVFIPHSSFLIPHSNFPKEIR